MRTFSGKAIILAIVAAVAAFALGRLTAPQSSGSTEAMRATAALARSTAGQNTSAVPRAQGGENNVSKGLSAEQARLSLKQLDQTAPCGRREDDRLKLLLAWAATDPLGAIEYAKKNLKSDRLMQAMDGIVTTWAKNDPSAAWTWSRSLTNNTSQAYTVLEEIGRNDPDLAARLAADFARQNPGEAVTMCMTAMRAMAYNGNFDAALKLAAGMQVSSPEEKTTLLNFMAGQWASYDPEKAAQWVQTLPDGPDRDQALIGLGASWAEKDPPGAADFAVKLPAGTGRQTALKQAIEDWIVADPVAAATWINAFPPQEDLDQAVASVATLRSLVDEHVDVALSWASTIVNDSLRTTALSEILSNWAARDPAAALNYAQTTSGLSDEARAQLVQQLQPSGQ